MNEFDELDNFFRLTPDYIDKICKVAGEAFQEDPTTIFIYPEERERKEKLQYGFRMIYNYGMSKGVAYATSSNLEGFIVWLPPNKTFPSTWTLMRHGGFYTMRKVGLKLKAMKRTFAVFGYIETKHKEFAPFDHWYLQNIAVKPEEQKKGYGGLLISAMLKKIDREEFPIYLETNNEKNLSFYQRYGFEIIEHIIIPETDVPLWCLLRNSK
ncbi:MAG: GNAT family N-acetyltransferase [Candidatus Thorarchaeota archaeon]